MQGVKKLTKIKRNERLKREAVTDPFKLSQGDDSWGFQESPLKLKSKLSVAEKILYTIIGLYFLYYIFEAIKFIF